MSSAVWRLRWPLTWYVREGRLVVWWQGWRSPGVSVLSAGGHEAGDAGPFDMERGKHELEAETEDVT